MFLFCFVFILFCVGTKEFIKYSVRLLLNVCNVNFGYWSAVIKILMYIIVLLHVAKESKFLSIYKNL